MWKPEPLFFGQRVFLLGGGPSLNQSDVNNLCSERSKVIAINNAAKLASWADVLFFRDLGWFLENKSLVLNFEGEVITSNSTAPKLFHTIRKIKIDHVKDFQPLGSDSIKYGRTSGHLAVSLAITMGAREIVLMGFDCRTVNGRSHWDQTAPETPSIIYDKDFLGYWDGWGNLAERMDVKIINTTPNSAIKEFMFSPFEDLMASVGSDDRKGWRL